MWLFEWWGGLRPRIRFGLALVPLIVSTALWLDGTFWPWGWAAGCVMLPFAFPSANERKGYHDF